MNNYTVLFTLCMIIKLSSNFVLTGGTKQSRDKRKRVGAEETQRDR